MTSKRSALLSASGAPSCCRMIKRSVDAPSPPAGPAIAARERMILRRNGSVFVVRLTPPRTAAGAAWRAARPLDGAGALASCGLQQIAIVCDQLAGQRHHID